MGSVLGDEKKRGNDQEDKQHYAGRGPEPATRLRMMCGGHRLNSSKMGCPRYSSRLLSKAKHEARHLFHVFAIGWQALCYVQFLQSRLDD
jgi:hypothetical protein